MSTSVLIVDDHPAITGALMTRLIETGYEVNHAINGLAGVEAAAMHRPDVIILDIEMPDIDGFDTFNRIVRLPELRETPVIFLSGHTSDAVRDRVSEIGGAAFLPKPFTSAQVIETINRVIRREPLVVEVEMAAAPRASILIIDNDEAMVEVLSARLEHAGYRCVKARSGAQGLAEFREDNFDLVITDLNMPSGDGVEVARSIRRTSEVPIIVVTGFSEHYRYEVRTINDVTILRKPFRTVELINLIEATVLL